MDPDEGSLMEEKKNPKHNPQKTAKAEGGSKAKKKKKRFAISHQQVMSSHFTVGFQYT